MSQLSSTLVKIGLPISWVQKRRIIRSKFGTLTMKMDTLKYTKNITPIEYKTITNQELHRELNYSAKQIDKSCRHAQLDKTDHDSYNTSYWLRIFSNLNYCHTYMRL